MVKRMAKGLRTQRKVKEWLESLGYIVYMVAHSRWSKDIFGLWDAFSIKDGRVTFIQIKTNATGIEKKTLPHKEFCEKHKVRGEIYNIIEKKNKWQIIEYGP